MNILNTHYASKEFSDKIWPDFYSKFKSKTSISSYQTDISEFLNFIRKDFLNIYQHDIDSYFSYLKMKVEEGTLKPNTMAKKFRELHSIAAYIERNIEKYDVPDEYEDYFYPYLLQVAKVEDLAKTIPAGHIDRLLEVSSEDHMFFCMLTLIFRVGLSSTELIELKPGDFSEYDNGVFVFIESRKEWCYVPEDAANILTGYLNERQFNEYLFYNTKGNKLNVMYVSRLMKKWCRKAGIPEYSAQSLRGACANTMFSYGATSEQVAKQIGVTPIQIKRYKNIKYKNELLSNAGKLVKIKIEMPD